MKSMSFFDAILDILFPRECRGCRSASREDAPLCSACLKQFTGESGYMCGFCRGRVPPSLRGVPLRSLMCHPRMPYLLISLTRYHSPAAKAAIHALKFERCAPVAALLGSLVARRLIELRAVAFDCVIPVPLSAQRLRERGFNQAEAIAEPVARALGCPIRTDVLMRRRHTQAQSTLHSHTDREANVAGSFCLRSGAHLRGQRILLIDDVSTSGATLAAAVQALRDAGAAPVICAVIAQA